MSDYQVVFEPPPYDYDNDGSVEAPKFVLAEGLRVSHQTRTGFLIDGQGSTVIDTITDLYDDLAEGDDLEGRRKGFYLDLGGGAHVVDVEAQVSGPVPPETDHQWGTGDGDPATDATGAHPIEKIQLLDKILQIAEIDSRGPQASLGEYPEGHTATLSIGRYSADGPYDPLQVAPEEPEFSFDSEQETSTATVSINFVDIFSLGQSTDAAKQDLR